MGQSKLIRVIVFSYKNKNLETVIKSVIENATNNLCIDVVDKNTIDRKTTFEKYNNVWYHYKMWTKMDSPTEYKNSFLHNQEFDYFLIISDDVLLKQDWDKDLLEMYKENTLISGQGRPSIYHRNKFFLGKSIEDTQAMSLTGFIDRNFIFGSREAFSKITYPTMVKYHGEEEMLSINAFCNGVDIYSLPTGFYEDLLLRTIENIYTPFSIQHGYNNFVNLIKNKDHKDFNAINDFIRYHRIEVSNINHLPFERNDVMYDVENTLHKDKGEKFFNRRTAV